MLKKIISMLFVFLSIVSISEALKIKLPEITRNEEFLPLKTDLFLKIQEIKTKKFNKNILLITPENWDHFIQLFNEYQLNAEEWVSPFIAEECKEIIFYMTMLDIDRMQLAPNHIAFLPILLPHLRALSLREYCAHNELIMAIAKIETLEEIDLWQNHATKEGIKELALLPNLKKLNLGFNDIHHTSLSFEEIRKVHQYIQSLEDDLLALNQSITVLSNIEKMRKKVLKEEIEQLKQSAIEALSKNSSLQKLNLTGTQLTKEELKFIATMNNLKRLNLTANYLQNQGAEIIAGMNHLESLNVTGNKITDVGIEAFCQMKNLKKMNVSRNQFSDVGEGLLSDMRWLSKLTISENDFVANGFINIRNMPETTVIELDEQKN
jgi:Leucine-rich repeat (LRR) protein